MTRTGSPPGMLQDDEIVRFSSDFRRAIIGSGESAWMCFAISGPLAAALRIVGVPASLVESDLGVCDHAFIVLNDGRVLDPTADQFNWCSRVELPPVYLGPTCEIHTGHRPHAHPCVWDGLMQECKRLCPGFSGSDVGMFVRATLQTFPSDMIELPTLATPDEVTP